MKLYWANAIGKTHKEADVSQFFTYSGSFSMEEAEKVIHEWRKHYTIYSSWIVCEGKIVSNDTYVDAIGLREPECSEQKIDSLAERLDNVMYDFDTYEYHDSEGEIDKAKQLLVKDPYTVIENLLDIAEELLESNED